MSGLEVAGWFAAPLIDKVFGLADSLFEQTRSSEQETEALLYELKTSLLTVKGQIESLEKNPFPSQTLPDWLRELKEADYEAFDVLDAIEYKNISEKFNYEGHNSINVVGCDLENLKSVVHKIKTVCCGVNTFTQLLNQKVNEIQGKQKRPKKGDTTYHLDGLKVFGRDDEIKLIVDMMGTPPNNPESSERGPMNNPESSQRSKARENPEPSKDKKCGIEESSPTVEISSVNYPV